MNIILKAILKETEYYLEVFHRLEKQANEKDKELFEYIVAHEVAIGFATARSAIAQFAEIELINSSNNSLKSIESLLNN